MNYRIMMILCVLTGMLVSAQEEPEKIVKDASFVTDPKAWDKHYFSVLSNEDKKLIIGTLKKSQHLLKAVHKNVNKGAELFVDASGDLASFYRQCMITFSPSQYEVVGCLVLPCHIAYKAVSDRYNKYEPVVAALDILPSIDSIWERCEEYLPEYATMTNKSLKEGIAKAFRKAVIKKQIEYIVHKHIERLDMFLDYIAQVYPEIVIEQQIEQEKIKQDKESTKNSRKSD